MLNTVILQRMKLRKFRWSKDYESAEEELIELLGRKHIEARRIHVEPHEELHRTFTQSGQIWCAEGSFIIKINDTTFSMQPGDALDIPHDSKMSGMSGMTGCAYYLNEL